MAKKSENRLELNILWVIIAVLALMVGLLVFDVNVGQGRWECDKYENYTIQKCKVPEQSNTTMVCSISQVSECKREIFVRQTKK